MYLFMYSTSKKFRVKNLNVHVQDKQTSVRKEKGVRRHEQAAKATGKNREELRETK